MYHASFVLPAVFACYKTDGNLKKDNAYLHRLIDANIEGYRAIRNAGHEILPDADKEFEGAACSDSNAGIMIRRFRTVARIGSRACFQTICRMIFSSSMTMHINKKNVSANVQTDIG